MSDYKWKTKKEIILENASKDPFLKIEDLAKLADTTSRYVRTILSEANISLMELRKQYARNMENIYKNVNEKILFSYVKNVPFSSKKDIIVLEDLVFNNPQDFNELTGNINNDYITQSYLHYFKERPWCISTIIADKKKFDLDKAGIPAEVFFQTISKSLKKYNLQISNIDIEIELSTGQISDTLDISSLSPVYRVKQILEKSNNTVVLMLVYFNSKQVALSLSYNNGLVIRRKGMTG